MGPIRITRHIRRDVSRCISALYEGYVKNTNMLNERLTEIRSGKAATQKAAIQAYAELVRRLGFEYNGMRCTSITSIT